MSAPHFCDREKETEVLKARMRDGIHVFVLSPRRYGKTSLLERAGAELQRDGAAVGYLNLLFCSTPAEVASAILSAVVDATLSRKARATRSIEALLKRLRVAPVVSFDASGALKLSVEPSLGRRTWEAILHDARDILIEESTQRPAALILDEFQAVASIGPKGMGGVFKALADGVSSASLVFSGSHLSVMESLTTRRGSPLYGMGERIVLDVIPEAAMLPYLQRRAKFAGRTMPAGVARLVYERARAVPHYVQYLAQATLDGTEPGSTLREEDVLSGLNAVVAMQAGDYVERFEVLAGSQQRILRALAATPSRGVYARDFLDQVDVGNANGVTQAVRVLEARELIQRRKGVWTVVDPFFAHWLADSVR